MLEERQYVEAGLRAAIDAYEAKIAELESHLARVKAESLRVVPDGDETPFWCLTGNDPLFLTRERFTFDGSRSESVSLSRGAS